MSADTGVDSLSSVFYTIGLSAQQMCHSISLCHTNTAAVQCMQQRKDSQY